jgi:Protein of unknown function (DUF3618)
MAHNSRTAAQVRRDIAAEREQLAEAVDELRADLDIRDMLRARLPLVAVGALGAGFVVAGGIGAAMRFVARRGREGKEKARVGPFSFIHRD